MRWMIIVGLVLFFSSLVSAQTTIDWDRLDCAKITYDGKALADTRVPLPMELGNFLDKETVNLTVRGSNIYLSGYVSNGSIGSLKCNLDSDATMRVWIEKDSIEKIANSSTPMKTLKQLLSEKKILITSTEFGGMIKIFFTHLLMIFV